ncbi:securin-like [Callospermophilus lateralis]|uniref:securin-like n=1 Tax=Callospermophilus lateralis TaxID=76772 RepID=UPI0040541545
MATLIFVDKENGEPCTHVAPKEGVSGPVKALDRRSHQPPFGCGSQHVPKTVRKALGTVNRATEKTVKTNAPLKQKQPTFPPAGLRHFTAKKMTEKTLKAKSSGPASDETYPEIENFFPFNPLDFESFELPEEHPIAHIPLSGVPLMILDEERGLEKLLQLGPPSPVKMLSSPWASDPLKSPSSILSALDVDLPPVYYDIDI